MRVGIPNIHFDTLRQIAFAFKKIGWKASLLSSPEFDFLDFKPALSDPDGKSRNDYQTWVAEQCGLELCGNPDDAGKLDLALFSSEDSYRKGKDYFHRLGGKTRGIFYWNNGFNPAQKPDLPYPHFWTCFKPAMAQSRARAKLHWWTVAADVYTEYRPEMPSPAQQGFNSYVHDMQALYSEDLRLLESAESLYHEDGGVEPVRFYGKRNRDGLLTMGKYGDPDTVMEAMRASIATVHPKPLDAPGYVLLKSLLLGKPTIVEERLIRDGNMEELLDETTCIAVESPREMADVMSVLDKWVETRSKGWEGARRVREICSWDRVAREFENWVGAVMASPDRF